MALEDTPYDDVVYVVDLAVGRAAAGDTTGVLTLVDAALERLARMPYPGLLREARLAGTDAADSARLGDFERAAQSLWLFRHVVEDAARLEYQTLLTA
ncbi:hypothetical protein N0B31_09935 [Salinirubellus salinus]|jgi:hypothetical protein|uniref:Uncharacterized protein n=1 Tax=Salinirubellus salinus TaxID=1364945 RepID=A0A9E7U6L5_9EURY|nr:hypothetical protein [Salinirubellus salinus]UWM56595.1 hypothetical protein N0B31_09935 [Salinirubellus salinus]